jgi:hypothetical protein
VLTLIKKVLDSTPFRIFFAVWTGLYLLQVIRGEEGAPTDEFFYIIAGFAVAILIGI